MKRFVTLLILSITSLALWGQGSIALLDRVPGQRVQFHYTYSLSRSGGPMQQVTDGEMLLEGNAYRLSGLGLDIRSDGSTRWSADTAAEELIIETVDQNDILTNPVLFLSSYKKYGKQLKVNASGPDSLDVTLTLDEDTRARFVLKDVRFLEPRGPEGLSDFIWDVSALPSTYVVTDLR